MNKNSDNETEKTINKFSDEFSDIISPDLKLKLRISKLYLSGLSTPKVKENLETQECSSESEQAILPSYLKPDCNKLYRIRNNSTQEGLIKLIKVKNICTYILQKYPSPDIVGFPYNVWTPCRLKKYICMLLNVSKKQINKKTISNVLSNIYHTKINEAKGNKPIGNRSIDIGEKRYYLYITISNMNSKECPGKRKYNRHIFAALLELINTNWVYRGKISKSYYAQKKTRLYYTPDLYKILDKLLSNEKDSTIYIENSSLNTFRNKSFHSLKSLPTYRFILFDFEHLQRIKNDTKISGKNIDNNLKALEKAKNLKQEVNQICFSNPSEKKQFIDNMSKKIKELCRD